MMPADGAEEDRVKYHRALIGGPQPSSDTPARSPDGPGDIPGGTGKPLPDTGSGLRARPPDGIAELLVYEAGWGGGGERRYGLKVACSCQGMRIVDLGVTYLRPDLGFAENAVEGGPTPTRYLSRVDDWSYQGTKLAEWLNLHRGLHPDVFQLVIRDDTPYRIPWELFWLPSIRGSELRADSLGAVLKVSRWLRIDSYWSRSADSPASPVPRLRGSVAAYVAATLEHDRDLLKDYVVAYANNMQELFDNLNPATAESRPLAMVYIAADGELGEEPADYMLDKYLLGRATRLNDDLRRVRDPATFVFLNGCYTGLVTLDVTRFDDRAPRGFAVVFLRSGAAGVLATTGAVGNLEANQLAGKLLGQFRIDQDASIDEALRLVRLEAAQEINELLAAAPQPKDIEKKLLRHLYPFMYVYFGNPGMLVSIDTDGTEAGTDTSGTADSSES